MIRLIKTILVLSLMILGACSSINIPAPPPIPPAPPPTSFRATANPSMTVQAVDQFGNILNGTSLGATANPQMAVNIVNAQNQIINAFSTPGASTGVVTVTGGDPTGQSPSTAAFQAAFTAGCNGGTNGAVYMPAGAWKVGQITGFSGPCTIYGDGEATQIIPDTSIVWGADEPIFLATNGANKIRFTNFDIDDPSPISGGPIIGIEGFLPTQCTIDNVKMFSADNNLDFCTLLDGANHTRFSGDYCFNVRNTCYFMNTTTGNVNDVVWDGLSTCDTTGTESAGRGPFTDGATTNNSTTFTSTAQASFVSGDSGRVLTATGVPANDTIASVTNSTTVVLTTAATATATGLTFSLSQVATAGGNGFFCANNTNNTNGCSNVRVSGVHATNVYDTGIEIGSGGGTGVHTGITVDGAIVVNNIFGKAGILCRDCNNFVLSNNYVQEKGAASTSAALYAWASEDPEADGLINGNVIVQPSGGGSHGSCVRVASASSTNKTSRISVNNNDCFPGTGTDTNGILVAGYDTGASFVGNVVNESNSPTQTGFYINCSVANCIGLNVNDNNITGGFNSLQLSNVTYSSVTNNLLWSNNSGQPSLLAANTMTGTVLAPNFFYNDGSTYGGPFPTVASCGSSPTQPVTPSSNMQGCATIGSGSTTCIVSFAPQLANTPLLVSLVDETTLTDTLAASSISTSSFTVNGATAGDKFCWTLPNASN